MDEPTLRVALIGYGLAGRVFHAPLIAATPGIDVTTVVTADPVRRRRAAEEVPGAQVLESASALWEAAERHDLVVVATGTAAHVPLAEAAVDAGLAVVVEKPLAPQAGAAAVLVARAAGAGVVMSVFHNRRWDAEHLTLRRLVSAGALGEVTRYESRFERWRPESDPGAWRHTLPPEQGGGVLLDLGVHLVDQARELFGPVAEVYGEVASRRGGADDDVFMALTHRSGVRSHLWASALAAAPGPRLRVLGTSAAFMVEALDGQEDELRTGRRADDPAFGVVPPERWGCLRRGDDAEPVPSEAGRWTAFYQGMVRALRDGAPPPVEPGDAVAALAVLDAARRSASHGVVVPLDVPESET